jgi:uncharacterized protein YejL (UPF0352 family)
LKNHVLSSRYSDSCIEKIYFDTLAVIDRAVRMRSQSIVIAEK